MLFKNAVRLEVIIRLAEAVRITSGLHRKLHILLKETC